MQEQPENEDPGEERVELPPVGDDEVPQEFERPQFIAL